MRRVTAALVAGLLVVGLDATAGAGAEGSRGDDRVPVVVAFTDAVGDPEAETARLERRHDFETRHVYRHALAGFAAEVREETMEALTRNPRVKRVEHEATLELADQTLPTGADRVEADQNPHAQGTDVSLDMAIIDTGLDRDHPDLDVAGGRNFVGQGLLGGLWDDDHGHGTHVGGTAGAIDNGAGVVGVAPGAPLWAVKVCNLLGLCLAGDVIAGIDWVAGRKASGEIDFAAANMSLSSADADSDCSTPADAVHEAICGAVAQGVVVVLAAGNNAREKEAYPVAFTVSAVADFDGAGGAAGSPTCRDDQDDTLADFSNHGPSIDLAAPGVCILSTWNDGGAATISGTSMAAPHAAGAVALYLHATGGSPAQDAAGVVAIEQAIRGAALPRGTDNDPCSYDDGRDGGPLLFVNDEAFNGTGDCTVS